MKSGERELGSGPSEAAVVLLELLDHEVRSPLTLVYGWTELLADDAADGLCLDLELLDQLVGAVTGMTRLVVTLLEEATRRLHGGDRLDAQVLVDLAERARGHSRV